MEKEKIHVYECKKCQEGQEHNEKELHHQMNVLMSRMDEQQRRWYGAVEAQRRGHGGMSEVSKITGLHVETLRRGRDELAENLQGRPEARIRLEGAGRPRLEKRV